MLTGESEGLRAIKLIVLASSVRQYIESTIYPRQLRTILELDQLSSVAGMVRAGLGVTVVPALTLFHFEHPDLAR
jgi:DNA-binding transcriptional LysR family regulator